MFFYVEIIMLNNRLKSARAGHTPPVIARLQLKNQTELNDGEDNESVWKKQKCLLHLQKKTHGSVAHVPLMFYTCLRDLLQRMVKQKLVILFLTRAVPAW